jgi:hypothetical protein
VSSSSICIRDDNASISALSLQSPMAIDGTSADVRALGKRPGSELRVVAMDHGFAASRLALLDRHLERVCREGGGRVLADRPADHTAVERVEHDGAVHLALTGRMLRDAEVHPGSDQT